MNSFDRIVCSFYNAYTKNHNTNWPEGQVLFSPKHPLKSLILLTLSSTQSFPTPALMAAVALGAAKPAVPTCTAVAPTIRYSITSSAISIPPKPIIGILTTLQNSRTRARGIGLMEGAGKQTEQVPKRDFRVLMSTLMAG